jgi:hypothetical protein
MLRCGRFHGHRGVNHALYGHRLWIMHDLCAGWDYTRLWRDVRGMGCLGGVLLHYGAFWMSMHICI